MPGRRSPRSERRFSCGALVRERRVVQAGNRAARVLIVVAGMEGALLGMLDSCASGVVVVNIDNGFGAACMASRANHLIPNSQPLARL
jgi:NCAIR mutase (PurE)-related protein